MRSGLLLFTTVLLLLMSSCATPEPTRREPSGRAGAPVTRTVDGYRIQIATTDDRGQADEAVEAALAWYDGMASTQRPPYLGDGDLDVDVAWKAPYYRVHVGRFANRAEGERALQAVVSEFPGAFLVPTRVTVTR